MVTARLLQRYKLRSCGDGVDRILIFPINKLVQKDCVL